ncbi:thiol reductant ABC exporter subunit CydD [Sphingobium aquiterrae]|uniref:thiol reductant ABC exporter subunit CydD n=1 Tax=Sphingobium aquiterrae TaxID=2038656 RepID=UPI0030189170
MRLTRTSLFWLLDAGLASAFAAAVAWAVAGMTARGGLSAIALLAIGCTGLMRGGLQIAAAAHGQWDAARAKQRWRKGIFLAVLGAAPGARRLLGEQIADATDRIEDVEGYHARFMPLRLAAMLAPLIIAGAVATASRVSAAILLTTLIPFALGMMLAGSAAGRVAARQLETLGRLSGLFVDRVRALPVITGFAAEDRIGRQLAQATQDVARRTIAVLRVAFLSGAVIEFFAALSVALVAVYCGFTLLGLLPFPAPETLDLARALFVLILAPEFYLPMRRLAAAYHDKQVGEAAHERLAMLADGRAGRPAQELLLQSAPAISFEKVVIDYGERAIGPFSMTIAPGQVTALLGPTGAGKSSLLHSLLGLAPVASGVIRVDGMPLVRGALCGAVGWASQATALIPGTIADNIRLARPAAQAREVEMAAHRAGLTALAESRSEGLATVIDARGSGLSGGERRRIGIARALLRDAQLWLLDEPTADLDQASAAAVIAEILAAAHGRTVLLVTHSEAIAARADHRITLA